MPVRATIVCRPILKVVVALLFFVPVATLDVVGGETDPQVSLRWALGALDTGGGEPTAVARDTQLETGTRLKFLVEPLSAGSVYLILLDSSDEIHVLYRESSPPAADAAEPTYIPPGRKWFELDDSSGAETFFLLASVEPLAELERFLTQHAAGGAEEKRALGSEIVQEIRRLHKAHRNFSRPAEKPVMIGGQTRGTEDGASAIDQLAVEVTAERFYGKTITIEH